MLTKHPGISRLLWLVALIEGFPAIFVLITAPSEAGAGRLLGLSYYRLGLAGLCALLWVGLALTGGYFLLYNDRQRPFLARVEAWLIAERRLRTCLAVLAGLALFFGELVLFTFMFLPAYLRGLAAWGGLAALQGWLALRLGYRKHIRSQAPFLPRLNDLDAGQKRVLAVLCAVGLVYFAAFIPTNLRGAEDPGRLLVSGGDEVVIYPVLTTLLTPGETFRATLYHVIEYDDYHYGYPFYALSALVLLPSRIIWGDAFAAHTQINLFLLRQLVSVLPLLLACLVLTGLATRLRGLAQSLLVFALFLSLPAVLHYNQRFWHPDGLAVLLVALTFFFLARDRLRLGGNFYFAALLCGLASAVRLVGFFFVLAIAGYLLAAELRRHSLVRIFAAGAAFILVMAVTILLSDPFLFDAGARSRMLAMMSQKNVEMTQGYNEPDPEHIYRTGWEVWLPFFEKDYAAPWFLGFLIVSAGLAALAGRGRAFPALLLGWALVMGGYLVYFVAAKAYQYSLPLFVPLYAASFWLPGLFGERSRLPARLNQPPWRGLSTALALAFCLAQLAIHIAGLPALLHP